MNNRYTRVCRIYSCVNTHLSTVGSFSASADVTVE
jgi:hypothetical protein